MIPFHPLADIFPLIEGQEFEDLVRDISQHGLREQIVLFGGKILDGRNRYRACVAAKLLPESLDQVVPSQIKHFRQYMPMGAAEPSEDDLLAFVLSKNLHRRQLNESQRAAVGANIANMRQGERTDLSPSANLQKVAQADAARRVNVSPRLIADAVKAKHEGSPEVFRAIEQGRLPASSAAKLVSLPPDEQRRIVGSDDVARTARTEVAKQVRVDREKELADKIRALPTKRYGVIYADPEWRFEPYSRETGMEKSADNHYPTSATDFICARPVSDIAADSCVLFLWATVPMLPDALRVMAAWGFEYKSHCIWAKDRIGTGYWFRSQHEILLVGTRGDELPAPAMGTQVESLVDAAVARHSEKPERFYEIIEAYFPNLPKIELNARRVRENWDRWGNEAEEAA